MQTCSLDVDIFAFFLFFKVLLIMIAKNFSVYLIFIIYAAYFQFRWSTKVALVFTDSTLLPGKTVRTD